VNPENNVAPSVDAEGATADSFNSFGLGGRPGTQTEPLHGVNTESLLHVQGRGRDGMPGEAGRPPGLPCLLSEQLNPSIRKIPLPPRHRRLAVELEIQGLVMRHGVGRIGFLTFTFADDVRTVPEASRRMNSLLTNQLSKRYSEWLSVVQRHKDGKIHFHFVVVMKEDIRTGFNHGAVARRDYSSASPYLRGEWAWLRATLPEYNFGRHELLPVKVAEGFGRYVARYVAGNTKRQLGDKGARLVRFSRSFVRSVHGVFSPWNFIGKRVQARKAALLVKWPCLERVLENSWLPSARRWLPWLLWSCPDQLIPFIYSRVEDDLALYSGVEFVLQDRVLEYRQKHLDRLAREAAEGNVGMSFAGCSVSSHVVPLVGSLPGAGVAPDRPAGRSQVMRLPGEVWLQRD